MIKKIGVLHQDVNSFGFLEGIRRRLQCDAVLVEPANRSLSRSSLMTRTQAKAAFRDLQKQGVDLIVRFTDADGEPWQKVKTHEFGVFPSAAGSILICGVAVENTEQWLALDRNYLANELDIPSVSKLSNSQVTDAIKSALARKRNPDEPTSEVVARLVANAPGATFQNWLRADSSLQSFYEDCRLAAIQAGCTVPNEFDQPV